MAVTKTGELEQEQFPYLSIFFKFFDFLLFNILKIFLVFILIPKGFPNIHPLKPEHHHILDLSSMLF